MSSVQRVALCIACTIVGWSIASIAFAGILAEGPTNLSSGLGSINVYPVADGDRVAWVAPDDNDWEIYTWKRGDASPLPLTDNDVDDANLDISGDRLVWCSGDSGNGEIWTWRAGDAAPQNISNNPGRDDYLPSVFGDRVVWVGQDANDDEIFMWEEGDISPTNISQNDGRADTMPSVWGDRVVWEGVDGSDREIYTWKVGDVSPVNVSNRDLQLDGWPSLYADRISWSGMDGSDQEVFTWKLGDLQPTQVTDNVGIDDMCPQTSGELIVWTTNDTLDTEVMSWRVGDSKPTQVGSVFAKVEANPVLDGDRAVWTGYDGVSSQVYTWKSGDSSPTALTSSGADEGNYSPSYARGRVVWTREGLLDTHVYTAVFDSTPPSLTVPSSVTLHASAPAGVSHAFAASATDPGGITSLKYYIGSTEITSPHSFGLGETQVRCVAIDEAGNTSSATFTITVLLDTILALRASPSIPSYGGATMLTAALTARGGEPIIGESIVFERLSGGSWVHAGAVASGAGGVATLKTAALKTKQTYRARSVGTSTRVACEAVLVVYPKVKMSRTSSWKARSRNKSYVATGYITPKHATSDKNKIRVRAYKKGKDGKYRYVKSFTAKYVYFSKTKTKYKASVKFSSKGSWALRAYHPADKTHAATFGSWDYFKVK